MKIEIICALMTFGGIVVSALFSYVISRFTANKEIERMKLTWEREDVISSDDEFAAMAGSVAKFVSTHSETTKRRALEQVASIRSKETGELGRLLDNLYLEIQSGYPANADIHLSQVIDQKREAKIQAKATERNKPNK